MAVISVNSISGISSITAQSGTLEFYNASGSIMNVTGNVTGNLTGNVNASGVSTFSGGINVGTGTSISSPATNVLVLGTNNAERVRITGIGSVGISEISPDLPLHISGSNAYPASSGSIPRGFISLRAKSLGATHGLHMGVAGAAPYGSWIQAQDANSLGTNYPLLLNPNGGNIGIGTINPSFTISTYGTGAVRHEIVCTDNNSTGAGIYLRTLNSGTQVSNATIRTNNSGIFSIFNGTTSDIESLKIDSSGRMTLPYQPSFFATHSSETGHLRPNANNPFIFPLAPTNVGGHYNTSNGRFTAPISGRYWFQFSGGLMELDSQRGFDIRVNGSVFNGGEAWHPDGYQTIVGKSVLLTLNINDYVTVTARSNVQLHQRYGNFCGFLIG